MASEIKWRVDPPPTGRYRSFQKRGWPQAEHHKTGRPLFWVICEQEYTNGKPPHAPLKLRFAKDKGDGTGWEWRTFKKEFASMKEVVEFSSHVHKTYKEWFI